MQSRRIIISLSIIAIVSGCASNSGVVKISPDTYMIFKTDRAGIFGDASRMKANVIREANAFAESQGKVAIPISTQATPMGTGPGQFATFEYQFKVIDKNDPEAQRTSLVPRADVLIEKNSEISVDIKSKDQTEKTEDVYAELIKLDDLRAKGIITEEEFEAQKKKLLSGQ